MMDRLLAIVFFLFVMILANGQDISRHEADSILQLLVKAKPGLDRTELLLSSAEFQIFKPGEYKLDLDSSAVYIVEAKLINKGINSEEVDGYITLVESYLTRERGERQPAKEMVKKAIQILSKGKDKLKLGEAYFELSQYYDFTDSKQFPEKVRLVELAVQSFQQSENIERQAAGLKFMGDLHQSNSLYSRCYHRDFTSEIRINSIHMKEEVFIAETQLYPLIGKNV
jgi:hypothetical protein